MSYKEIKICNVPPGDIYFSAKEIEDLLGKTKEKISIEYNGCIQKVLNELGFDENESKLTFKDLLETMNNSFLYKQNNSNSYDISNLKKRIKYCKNPIEKRKLEKELNTLYKNRKNKNVKIKNN